MGKGWLCALPNAQEQREQEGALWVSLLYRVVRRGQPTQMSAEGSAVIGAVGKGYEVKGWGRGQAEWEKGISQ